MSIEAMKQALAYIEANAETRDEHEIADGLRQAIEQYEKQKPVAWQGCDLDGMVEAFERVIEAHFFRKNPFHNPIDADAQMALRILRGFIPYMKQYTTPQPQREWVGLTDGEWVNIVNKNQAWFGMRPDDVAHEVCKLTEAKLKEKNT